jgi:hypothetical protein
MADLALVTPSYCKELLSLDDRDETILQHHIRSCSLAVERYLLRKIRERTITEYADLHAGQRETFLSEYPVRSVNRVACDETRQFPDTSTVPPEAYACATVPYESDEDLPSSILFDGFYRLAQGRGVMQTTYMAGYPIAQIPADIAMATVEIIGWNVKRFRSGQIGVSSFYNQNGRLDRNALERSMSDEVRIMLSFYARKTL